MVSCAIQLTGEGRDCICRAESWQLRLLGTEVSAPSLGEVEGPGDMQKTGVELRHTLTPGSPQPLPQ